MDAKEKVINFDALYRAMNKCANGVRWKAGTARYLENGLTNTQKLMNELSNGTYKLGKQMVFNIYEPKKREVVALHLRDRQVQRTLLDNHLYDEITRHFIYDNVACQKGKGTKAAVNRLKVMMIKAHRIYGNNYYIHLFDIRHFFASTSHKVAKETIRKKVRDEWACQMVDMLIDSFHGEAGIGLGSDIAQFIELSVLDDLDHFIKEKLHERFYLRYMDDFLIISGSKEKLKKDREAIENELSKICLTLHPSKSFIVPAHRGFKWQGFRVSQTGTGKIIMTIDKTKIYHMRRKLKKMVRLCKTGVISKSTVDNSLRCWTAHAKVGNNHKTIKKMQSFYRNLWKDDGNV
jgi:RNA-directed DNA polymerase